MERRPRSLIRSLSRAVLGLAVLACASWPGLATVTLVEPGHTLTQIADSCAPLDPSQTQLDTACAFGNAGNIESIAVDSTGATVWVQLHPGGAPGPDSCIFRITTAGGVTSVLNPSTGFGINERGTDMHLDPATGLLITQNQNAAPEEIAGVSTGAGTTGTYAPMPNPIFQGGAFGMDFSAGAGGSIVPAGDIVFTSDVIANGIHSTPLGGPVTTHVLPVNPGDDMVIQPDGDWVHVPDFAGVITAYDPFPPHLASPSTTGLNIQTMFNSDGLPFTAGTRATVCDENGEFYVSFSDAPGGSGIYRVTEDLTTDTLVVTITNNEGLQDLIVGPSSSGVGNSVYFTVHDSNTACEEVWELTIPECEVEICETRLFGAAHQGGQTAPSTFFEINPLNAVPVLIGPIGFNAVGGMDFHPQTGVLYAVGNDAAGNGVLITINPANGAGTLVGPLVNPVPGYMDLSFRNSDGALFLTAMSTVSCIGLFSVDVTSGLATEIGDTTTCSPGNALGFDWVDTLFHANNDPVPFGPLGTLHTVNQLSGVSTPQNALTYVGFPVLSNPKPNAMDWDPTTDTPYVSVNDGSGGAGPNYIGTLDASTGTVTFVGQTVNGMDALAWEASCDDNDPCTIDICKHCEEKHTREPPFDVLTVDCTPFVSPGGGPFGPQLTMGMALQAVDAGGDFLVTEVTPQVFRSLSEDQLREFNLIAILNHPVRLGDNCVAAAGNPGIGTNWHNVIGINSGSRVFLTSHDPVRAHMTAPPGAPPCNTGNEPFGAPGLIRQAALWAAGGAGTGLVMFNDSPAFAGGLGWDNPELNLPAAWGISDANMLPGLGGIGDGGYTEILAAYEPHPIYDLSGGGGVNLDDARLAPDTISSFAANVGDGSYESVFGGYNAGIFTASEEVINAGAIDVGGFGCGSFNTVVGPDGLAISLVREDDRNGDECPVVCELYGAAHSGGQNAPSTLYRIDPTSGASVPIGPIGFNAVSGLDFDAGGVLYGTGKDPATGLHTLITINPTNGVGSPVGTTDIEVLTGDTQMSDISFRNADNVLHGFTRPQDFLSTIALGSGAAAIIGPTGVPDCCGHGMGFDLPDTLWHAGELDSSFLNQAAGFATPVVGLSFVGFPPPIGLHRVNALDANPCTGLMYASVADPVGGGQNFLATFNPNTGVVTNIGPAANGLDAIAWRRTTAGGICCHIPADDTDNDGLCDPIDPCPTSPNPGGGNVSVFGQKMIAPNDNNLVWPVAVPHVWVRGTFTFSFDFYPYPAGPPVIAAGNSIFDPNIPPPNPDNRMGNGFWYLVRPDCPRASWTSQGPRECDGPPGNPFPCAAGDRDAFLP